MICKRLIALCLLIPVLVALAESTVEAGSKFPPNERIKVPSLTFTNEQFLRGDMSKATVVALTGELRFPSWSTSLPAIILLHGSDGFTSSPAYQWGEFLNSIGIATFRLDSFGGRGIDHVGANQSQLSLFSQLYDSYRAVDLLATHPRIDSSRIAVMGFSRGGVAALYASMKRFQKLYGPTRARIAAHLPFYPSCNIQLVDELDIADAPIREFHGAADDWTMAAPCRDYFERLRAAGKDVKMAEFPGAFHAFDDPGNPAQMILPNIQNMGRCQRREESGTLINAKTGETFTYNDSCVTLGPTIGYDEQATTAARASVKEFLTVLFHLN